MQPLQLGGVVARHIDKVSLKRASEAELQQLPVAERRRQSQRDRSVLGLPGEDYLSMRQAGSSGLDDLGAYHRRFRALANLDVGDASLWGAGIGGVVLGAACLMSGSSGFEVGVSGAMIGGVVGGLIGLATTPIVNQLGDKLADSAQSKNQDRKAILERLDHLAQIAAHHPGRWVGDPEDLLEQMTDQHIEAQLEAFPASELGQLSLQQLSDLAQSQAKQAVKDLPRPGGMA